MQVIELPARSRCRLSTKNFQVRFKSGAESDKKGRWSVEKVLKAHRMRLRGIYRAPPSRFRPHRSPGALQLCHRHRTTMAHGGAQIRSESSHLNNFFQLVVNPFLIEDPEGNMVRSLHFTHLPLICHTPREVSRGANETRLRPDAHEGGPWAPCRGRGTGGGARASRADVTSVTKLLATLSKSR